ncbi:hypothetical protein DFH06DRAFT_1147294 [Mycena polygramma]|nr:hypothetical protein DFH06DRAFT_1147294 [Mycena polygramma]
MTCQLRRVVRFTTDGHHDYAAAFTISSCGALSVEVQALGLRHLAVRRYLSGEPGSEDPHASRPPAHAARLTFELMQHLQTLLARALRRPPLQRLPVSLIPHATYVTCPAHRSRPVRTKRPSTIGDSSGMAGERSYALPSRPPTSALPEMDYDFVQFTRDTIANEAGTRSKTVKAILIPDGTAILRWVWARVPLHAGIQRAHTVDEIDTDVWFDAGRGVGTATSDLTNRSFQINRFPLDEPNDLKHSYTIVVAPQHTVGYHVHPVNHQINALVPTLGVSWRGNVLIFRHGKTANKVLINVEDKNWDAIELIVTT